MKLFPEQPTLAQIESLISELEQMIREHEDDDAFDTSEAQEELEHCQTLIETGDYADCEEVNVG